MPEASLEEKHAIQLKLWAFFDALYRIYERLEREHQFPLSDDNFK